MNTKKFFLTAFAVAALLTASFSNVFSSENELIIKGFSHKSADTTDSNPGGGPIPPIGR
jgi:hypothetical protein